MNFWRSIKQTNRLLFFFLFCTGTLAGQSGKQETPVIMTLTLPCNSFTTDPLGNIYAIRNSSFIKYSTDGKKLAEYSNLDLGSITSADASNPMRLILYYRDFNHIVFLDKFLSELRSPVSLDDLGMKQSLMVCSSGKGGFWIYHSFDRKLYYFNDQLEILAESMVIQQAPDEGGWLMESNQAVYLGFSASSILVFDIYANQQAFHTLPFGEDFQVWNGHLLFLAQGSVQAYNPASGLTKTLFILPSPQIVQVRMEGNHVFCREPGKIVIYNYEDLQE